jgi:hypothetical protein
LFDRWHGCNRAALRIGAASIEIAVEADHFMSRIQPLCPVTSTRMTFLSSPELQLLVVALSIVRTDGYPIATLRAKNASA